MELMCIPAGGPSRSSLAALPPLMMQAGSCLLVSAKSIWHKSLPPTCSPEATHCHVTMPVCLLLGNSVVYVFMSMQIQRTLLADFTCSTNQHYAHHCCEANTIAGKLLHRPKIFACACVCAED